MKWLCSLLLCMCIIFPTTVDAAAPKRVPILMYHSVAPFVGKGLRDLYVSPESFTEQMQYLKKHGYTPLTFEHWEDRNKVSKPVFITFDDGYENNLNAVAVFKQVQNKTFKPAATLYVVAGLIGKPHRLSAEALRKVSDEGYFSIQSHTMIHPDLRKTTNYVSELKTAKDILEKITGKPVVSFAYPYGLYNDTVLAETKKYYETAVTVNPGVFVETGKVDEMYKLRRQFVKYDTTMEEFAEMLR